MTVFWWGMAVYFSLLALGGIIGYEIGVTVENHRLHDKVIEPRKEALDRFFTNTDQILEDHHAHLDEIADRLKDD